MHSLLNVVVLITAFLLRPSSSLPTSWPAGDVEVPSLHAPASNVSYSLDFDDEYDEDEDDFAYLIEDDDGFAYVNDLNQTSILRRAATDAYLDCRGIEELCDANCYAILCLNQPQTLTKVSQTQATKNRQNVGAKSQPFKGTQAQLQRRGLRRPDPQHVSAEEYPFASTAQGGTGADVFPALVSQQNTQRDAIKNMYSTYRIGVGQNFNLKFRYANTPYCNALARGDYSVCNSGNRKRGPGGYDTGFFAYVRDSLKNQRLHFNFVGK